ncbi:hypothetical protein AX15_002946 [Amanita polypyramis BW_CC]|nr:hypothetical protein AX15_002946 [Amanita polypyramis BW_CC]
MASHSCTNSSSSPTLCDESCPLLGDQPDSLIDTRKPSRVTPLPKLQLTALCITRLVDPIAFTQVFPYINEFLASLHLSDEDPSRIGLYSGLVESSFAIAQLCSIYQWARVSDIIGRRPIIIGGALGLALTTLFFGLSTTFAQILISRCLAGVFSGNAAVVLSTLGELTDSTNQALAFPVFGLFWPLGSIVGPLIGGTFASPAKRFPELFDCFFMRRYPYFLPCFLSTSIAFSATVAAYFFLDETAPKKRAEKLRNLDGAVFGAQTRDLEYTRVLTMRELLGIPIIRDLSASGCALCFIATAYDVVFVLFCYTPISLGGLSFSDSQIGYSLAIAGSISAGIQLLFLPLLLRIFNNAKLYNFCMALWPFAFVVLPFLNHIAVNGAETLTDTLDAKTNSMLWVGVAVTLCLSRVGCLAYSISMVLVKNNVPNPSSLGATNGLVQFAMCISRAFSPVFVSAAFSWSLERKIMGGHILIQ